MSRYTIRRAWRRRWLVHCTACNADIPCVSWDVAVLVTGTPHDDHRAASKELRPVRAVEHPMTGEAVSSVQVWRDRNLFFRLPEFRGAA